MKSDTTGATTPALEVSVAYNVRIRGKEACFPVRIRLHEVHLETGTAGEIVSEQLNDQSEVIRRYIDARVGKLASGFESGGLPAMHADVPEEELSEFMAKFGLHATASDKVR